jgi:hypothetical protein
VLALADHQMVVDHQAHRLGGGDDFLSHVDIGAAWRRVAARVVMHQDDRRRAEVERALDDFTRIYRSMVHCAALLHLVGDQRVLAVQEEQAELFRRLVRHDALAIIQ